MSSTADDALPAVARVLADIDALLGSGGGGGGGEAKRKPHDFALHARAVGHNAHAALAAPHAAAPLAQSVSSALFAPRAHAAAQRRALERRVAAARAAALVARVAPQRATAAARALSALPLAPPPAPPLCAYHMLNT